MPQGSRIRAGTIAVAAGAAVLVLWGGYARHWSWTGINGHTATLWDWLHLLLLPVAVAILPLWLRYRSRLTARHRALLASVLLPFAALVMAGYLIPWAWTGFSGNKPWDWLELLALPLAVALVPLYRELSSTWTRRDSLVALAGAAAFAAIVIGGYVGDWSWTGFRGNTLWDWLHLLLLPLLLPLIIVPALQPMATAGLVDEESEPRATEGPPVDRPGEPQPTQASPR